MIVGRGGSTDNQLYAIRISLCLAQQLLHGTGHHIRGTTTLLWLEDVTCLDANTLHNPLVRSIYDGRHLLIVEDVVGNVASYASNNGIYFFHYTNWSLQQKIKPRKSQRKMRTVAAYFFTLED